MGDEIDLGASFVDPGTGATYQVEVDWGDGEVETGSVSSGAGGITLSHAYDDNGPNEADPWPVPFGPVSDSPIDGPYLYVARMVVRDGETIVASAVRWVMVYNVAPTLEDVSISPGLAGSETTLSGSLVDPGLGDAFRMRIDWGDGTVDLVDYEPGVREFSETHVYEDPGEYNATLGILDDDGGWDEWTGEATVS